MVIYDDSNVALFHDLPVRAEITYFFNRRVLYVVACIMSQLALLESFTKSFPEDDDGTLECGASAQTCAFNRCGTLLAVGCQDGRIVVWDMLTRGISKTYHGHVYSVVSVSWSRNGRRLVSSSNDGLVFVWHVVSGERLVCYKFKSQPFKVQCHPRRSGLLLVCSTKHAPALIDIDTDEYRALPVDCELDQNIVASFDRTGQHIFTGNSRGRILVVDTERLEKKYSFRVLTGGITLASIKSIDFCKRGSCFLVNSSDRVIRLFDSETLLSNRAVAEEPDCLQKMQDLVNRTNWKKCCFSGNGEFVVAGCSREHILHIWDTNSGNLVKILRGHTGETLYDVVWHPARPIITSICNGLVTIWSHNQVENWTAFAPNFKELEENEEYEEHESEFDVEDDDQSVANDDGSNCGEDVEVDVLGVDRPADFCSSDEGEEDDLHYLPVKPDIDDGDENNTMIGGATELGRKRPAEAEDDEDLPAKRIRTVHVTLYEDEDTPTQS